MIVLGCLVHCACKFHVTEEQKAAINDLDNFVALLKNIVGSRRLLLAKRWLSEAEFYREKGILRNVK